MTNDGDNQKYDQQTTIDSGLASNVRPDKVETQQQEDEDYCIDLSYKFYVVALAS